MSANVKFGEIETVVRRDMLRDNDLDAARWSSFQILAAINRAVRDVVDLNEWAAYDQHTCRRIYGIDNRDVARYCEADPKSLKETTQFVVGSETMTVEEYLAWVREQYVPIDGRWHDAIAYFAAYHVLDTAGADAEFHGRAEEYLAIARDKAVK